MKLLRLDYVWKLSQGYLFNLINEIKVHNKYIFTIRIEESISRVYGQFYLIVIIVAGLDLLECDPGLWSDYTDL